ncbi:MAG: SDR family NAD(P)-dependent oxidoreductase [Alphaproteobacteria bacterium]
MTVVSRPRIMILGALSAIAEAAAREWARQGARLLLVGRDAARLEMVAADLRVRGGEAEIAISDLVEGDIEQTFGALAARLGEVDIALVAYGVLGEQARAEKDAAEARRLLAVNFTSAARWCLAAANLFEANGRGTLIVLGSVAGDRGRGSNYIYGAAKGGLGILVQGLAHRLARAGARAILVKPGFVDTPMTASIAKKGPLWAQPAAIARVIVKAGQGKTGPVVYAPGFWRWIMLVIRLMPASIFHRTRL